MQIKVEVTRVKPRYRKKIIQLPIKVTIKLIKNVEIFDVFQAKNIPINKKSLGIRLIISSDSHTLTSEEIQSLETKALKKLNKKFGTELRG